MVRHCGKTGIDFGLKYAFFVLIKLGWALDQVALHNEVLKQTREEVGNAVPPEGVYIYGLFLEGAGWEKNQNRLVESLPKVLFAPLPVLHIYASDNIKPKDAALYEVYFHLIYFYICYFTINRGLGVRLMDLFYDSVLFTRNQAVHCLTLLHQFGSRAVSPQTIGLFVGLLFSVISSRSVFTKQFP